MALPKIDLPIYEVELPSTGKKIRYRPFTVREEKILLTAQETKEPDQIMLSIKQILNNCIIKHDIESLSIFDVEFMIIQIRSKSIDNTIDFEIKDPDTEETIQLQLDLNKVKVHKNPNHTNKIKISDEYTLFLKYPSINNLEKMIGKEERTSDDVYDLVLSCLDKLASKETVYNFKDFTKTEINDFIESLQGSTIKEIYKFFDTFPKVRHEMPYKNSKGEDKVFVIEGTQTFFI
jgi:hypothetical protein